MRSFIAFVLTLVLLTAAASAAEVILIESPGCQKCAAAERVLNGIMAEDPNLTLVSYYYYTDEGHRIIRDYKVKSDIPALIIGNRVIGYKDYNGDNALMERLIREALANLSQSESVAPAITMPGNGTTIQSSPGEGSDLNLREISFYTIVAVLLAGLFAGFNPCLLGILVVLTASVLSSAGRKREMVMMVVFFSLGIFTMYLLFGLGMQRLLQGEAVAAAFRYILTAILVAIGLAHVLDAVRLKGGKNSLFRTDWALKYFQSGVDQRRISSYFLIGALFSLVKLPCVGAIYLAILDLLSARSYLEGAVYLSVYNLGVVLPIILLGGFMALGMSPEAVDAFRKDHRAGMRLVTGLTLLLMAPMIYWELI